MLAAAGGHSETIVALLRHGANPSLLDDDQHSALSRAVSIHLFSLPNIIDFSMFYHYQQQKLNGLNMLFSYFTFL